MNRIWEDWSDWNDEKQKAFQEHVAKEQARMDAHYPVKPWGGKQVPPEEWPFDELSYREPEGTTADGIDYWHTTYRKEPRRVRCTPYDQWEHDDYGAPMGLRRGDMDIDPMMFIPETAEDIQDAIPLLLEVGERSKKPLPTVRNAEIIMKMDPRVKLRHDTRADQIQFDAEPPWPDDITGARVHGEWGPHVIDEDITSFRVWLDGEYGLKLSKADAWDAIQKTAKNNASDPVKEYLKGLEWDGVERLPQFCTKYFGAEDNEYTQQIGTKWMISAVARVFVPGCQVDHVLVIEGDQGLGKSSALRTLAVKPSWFVDHLPDLHHKDAKEAIQGPWIIEMAEMSVATRAEQNLLKNFLTVTVDRFRPSFGRTSKDHPRRCVFAATTNMDAYLKDETGGRRWWPFAAKRIDVAAIKADRDQLWAEAVARFQRNEPWWLADQNAVELAQKAQEERYERDPWYDAIEDWLAKTDEHVTTELVLTLCVKMDLDKINSVHKKRVGGVMRALGWRPKSVRVNGRVMRRWVNGQENMPW